MQKKTFLFFIVMALTLGYIVGERSDFFSKKSSIRPYTYNLQIPENPSDKSPAFSNVVKVISPLVVNISTTQKTMKQDASSFSQFFDSPFQDFFEPFNMPKKWKKESLLGSGVLVSQDGYIITNNHVVERSDEIKVTLYDQQTYKGKIIGTDPKTDIAVIKISTDNLPSIKWGDSDSLQVGEFVLAFGNPFSLGHTVTMGIVSAIGRANVGIADYEDFIQTDAAINPGNSGGPLVNIKGELVGINTAIFSKTGGYQGIGFAVPSNMVQSVMKQLIKEGKVTRGWLGVNIQNLTPELSKEFGMKKTTGALVTNIFDNSPASKSGLKRGDVIIAVNSKQIKNVENLRNIVSQSKIGKKIKITALRNNKKLVFHAIISEFPQDIVQTMSEENTERMPEEGNELAGFNVMDITRDIAKQLGLSRNESGVVIVKVDPYSPAGDAGLKKGDVIQEINKKRIKNSNDFNKITPHIRKGDTLLLFINRLGNKFYVTLKVYS